MMLGLAKSYQYMGEQRCSDTLKCLQSLSNRPLDRFSINYLGSLQKSGGVFRLLEGILRLSTAEIDVIATRSYRHPLGFSKICLAQQKDIGAKVRLHVWEKKSYSPNFKGDIHDHFWDFSSLILTGSLVSQTYKVSSEASPDFKTAECWQVKRGINGAFNLFSRPKVSLIELKKIERKPGQILSLRADQVHRAFTAGQEMTATLMLQGPPKLKCNYIYRTMDSLTQADTNHSEGIVYFKVDELVEMLERVCKTIPLDE